MLNTSLRCPWKGSSHQYNKVAPIKSQKHCILFVVNSSSNHEVYKLFGDEVPATKRQKTLEFKALSPTEKQKKIEDQDKVYKASKLLTSLQALPADELAG